MKLTTCQICGRDIKANTGLIAHHGYQRPDRGSGWQTASCFGARWRPYEVACDAIPPAIKMAEAFRGRAMEAQAKLRANPPETITFERRHAWNNIEQVTVTRPDGFTAEDGAPFTQCKPHTYESKFWGRHYDLTQEIRRAEQDIAHLNKRLAAWVA